MLRQKLAKVLQFFKPSQRFIRTRGSVFPTYLLITCRAVFHIFLTVLFIQEVSCVNTSPLTFEGFRETGPGRLLHSIFSLGKSGNWLCSVSCTVLFFHPLHVLQWPQLITLLHGIIAARWFHEFRDLKIKKCGEHQERVSLFRHFFRRL